VAKLTPYSLSPPKTGKPASETRYVGHVYATCTPPGLGANVAPSSGETGANGGSPGRARAGALQSSATATAVTAPQARIAQPYRRALY
jgi:hypothetical protein